MAAEDGVLVQPDKLREADLSNVGRINDRRYLVRTHPDGTMVFTPATVIPTHVLRLMENPEFQASVQHAREHPEELIRRTLRNAPDVDWERPD